jgi:uncharacterized protein YdeI (YjbR/CyaY-like superfamily)
MTKPGSKAFQATLERIDSPVKWVMIRIPFDASKAWGKRGQHKVRGEINGFAFRTTLFPDGKGGHRLLVNKQMQRGGKAVPGMAAKFRIEPDTDLRVVTLPVELKRAMSEDRSLLRWFDGLNHSTRSEIGKWVAQPKSSEARLRRAEQIAERLFATMEAEQELPPALQSAFEGNFLAREGWRQMSPAQRRGHLLGIFYYRSPGARARRIAKMMEEAVLFAERRNEQSESDGEQFL